MKISINYYLYLLVLFIYSVKCANIELPSALEASQTPLMQAVALGNIDNLKEILVEVHDEPIYYLSHADINAQDAQGRTALFIAAQEGQASIIKELLKIKDVDINAADNDVMTPLQIAATNGDCDTVNELLKAGPSLEQRDKKLEFTPLARATCSGNEKIIKLLLQAGANPTAILTRNDKNIPVSQLYTADDKEVAELLADKAKDFTNRAFDVSKALSDNKPDEANILLALGIDVNAKNKYIQTPLHMAAFTGHKNIVQLLINNKANVNAQDEEGEIALHMAACAEFENEEIIKLLIDSKSDVNAQCKKGLTPAHWAIMYEQKERVESLISKNADVNAKDQYGNTLLHGASYRGHKAVVEILINSKADINVKNKYGFTALDRAARKGFNEIVELLKKAGAGT